MKDLSLYERVAPLEKNFPVKFSLQKGNCYLHWHEHLELLYFLSDGGAFCGDTTYRVSAGDLIVVNSGELHATYSGRFYCMRLSPAFFADVAFENVLLSPLVAKDATVENCFSEIARVKDAEPVGGDMEIKALSYRLVCHLLRNYRTEGLSGEKVLAEKNKASRVGEIVKYIAHNCHERITTASLASLFHLDEHYLCRLFKSQMGVPPMQYVNSYRIEKAQTLLKNTDRSITDIALAVGFDDASYFARIFKKYTGQTPREYKTKK
ncbi:MAG: AraC family transcriptional regulator [Ruminococcaceae bacterium]|nr:AraC family transcriptional regulator [Oscillospiraceae bacterium]